MPWRSLGSTGWPTNAATGNRYRGGNVLALYLAAVDHGYPTARWATYKQWASLGAQVRKGEHGTPGIFWKVTEHDTADDTDPDDDDHEPAQRSAWARAFTVFNAAQVDNDPAPRPAPRDDLARLRPRRPSRSVLRRRPRRRPLGSRQPAATARPATTCVMPSFDAFHTAADAYGTLAHELTHWTGHPTRLARTYGEALRRSTPTPPRNSSPSSAPPSAAPSSASTPSPAPTTPATSPTGARCCAPSPPSCGPSPPKPKPPTDWLAAYSTTPADLAVA